MSDELNPLTRAFLDSVQDADDPTRADYDRVHAKVKTRLAAGIAAGIAALATSRATAATAAAKVATATAAATGVAAPTAAIATAGTGAALVGKIVAVVAVVAAVGGGTTAVVHYANRGAPSAPAPVASAVTTGVARPAPAPRPQPAPAVPTAAPETTAAPVPETPARSDGPRAPVPPAVVPTAAPAPTAAAASTSSITPSSLDAEIALVRDARAALRGGDAARSVALLDEHDRRFPGGALSEDCAAERVYALCALGNVDAAHAAASRFLADHPFSPHAAAVRTSCGSPGGMN